VTPGIRSAANPRRLGYLKSEIGEFPCIFPWNREPTGGDRFADDSFLHSEAQKLNVSRVDRPGVYRDVDPSPTDPPADP
jgi:hypothetical protein